MAFLGHDTFKIDQKKFALKKTLIIKDESGNELGRAVCSWGGSAYYFSSGGKIILYDSQENILGNVDADTYTCYDHTGKMIAKIDKQNTIRPEYSVEDPEGKTIYYISGNLLRLEYEIKTKGGLIAAQAKQNLLSIWTSFTCKIKNMNPLIGLLMIITIDLDREKEFGLLADEIEFLEDMVDLI